MDRERRERRELLRRDRENPPDEKELERRRSVLARRREHESLQRARDEAEQKQLEAEANALRARHPRLPYSMIQCPACKRGRYSGNPKRHGYAHTCGLSKSERKERVERKESGVDEFTKDI